MPLAGGLLLVLAALVAVAGSAATAAAPPVVTAVSPASGLTTGDTTVTVTGTGFTGATAVDFGSVPASYTVNSNTSITALSPGEPVGTVHVTVTTPNGLSAPSVVNQFTYLAAPAPPTVTAVSPDSGLTSGGATVAITGTGFTGAVAVDFGSVPATFSVGSDTSITATSPPETIGTVDITVTTPSGLSTTSPVDQFTFVTSGPAPTVGGVSPASGPATGGTSVTVTGTGLTGASAVFFGSLAATSITVTSDGALTAISPPASVGKIAVTVTTPNGTSATTNADGYTNLAAPPTVSALSPNSGPSTGGTSVTITGTFLKGATAVDFGSVAAPAFVVHSATSITATSPPQSVGTVDVTVTTANGTSATGTADQFTFGLPLPVISGLTPSSGLTTGGASVTISGSEFSGTTTVDFGTVSAFFTVDSASQITAIAPAQVTPGMVDVTVTNAGGTSATSTSDQFSYTAPPAPPTVKRIGPTSGSVLGATTVTIVGKGFTGAKAVDFGNVPGSFVVSSDKSIMATSPSEQAGMVDVTVTTPNGTSATSAADQFTFDTPPPVVTGIDPTSGTALGGTEVTITGDNLAGAFAVHFGSAPATIVVNSDSSVSITATAPAEAIGKVPVTVTTAYGTSVVTKKVDEFSFTTPPPVVTSVTPNSGPASGGTPVTIRGISFKGATSVDFGFAPAAAFTVTSNTSITATTPIEIATTVDVTVTTPLGTSATSPADKFNFNTLPPVVTGISPTTGSSAGGTVVTVTGSNLGDAVLVTFGRTPGTIVVNSGTSITVISPAGKVGKVPVKVTTEYGTSPVEQADRFTFTTPTGTNRRATSHLAVVPS